MTRAQQVKRALLNNEMSWTDLLLESGKIADVYEEDYENEITCFEYTDGSVAIFDGTAQEIRTYGSKE